MLTSTGGCIKCKRRVCDKHGLMVHGKFLCIPCHREMIKAERTALLPVESTRGREIGSTAPASADGGADSYKSYQSHYVAYKPNVEGIMFNLEPPYGGLVIYADYTWRGLSLRVQWEYEGIRRPNLIANVVMRKIDGNYEYAAVFSQVYQGNWVLPLDEGSIDFTVWPRQIAEVDLRVNR